MAITSASDSSAMANRLIQHSVPNYSYLRRIEFISSRIIIGKERTSKKVYMMHIVHKVCCTCSPFPHHTADRQDGIRLLCHWQVQTKAPIRSGGAMGRE